MANTKQSKKRAVNSIKRRSLNRGYKTKLNQARKKFFDDDVSNVDIRQEAAKKYQKLLDQAVSKGVIKKNKASREKSKAMSAASKLSA